MELNDELLCAYLDGELDEATRGRVAAALETDAGGRVRLERMRTADARLRREVPVPAAPDNDPVAEFILRSEQPAVPAFRAPLARRWYVGAALAAGIAGVVLGFMFARSGASPRLTANEYATGVLQTTLESRASGERVDSGNVSIGVLLTLVAADGRICRLFETATSGSTAEGIACREDRGWRVIAWDATVPARGGFHTAGASALLDLAMDHLDATTLDPVEERAVLQSRWQPRAH